MKNSRVNSRVPIYYIHMARKPLHKRSVRKLTRTGSGQSISVTLPIDEIRDLKWQDRQKVVIERKGDTLVIKDWKK